MSLAVTERAAEEAQRAEKADRRRRMAALYRLYGAVVYRRCLHLLREREEARDATQDVFLKLIRDLPRFQDRETMFPWMYRVATNHCLNIRRALCRYHDMGIRRLRRARSPTTTPTGSWHSTCCLASIARPRRSL